MKRKQWGYMVGTIDYWLVPSTNGLCRVEFALFAGFAHKKGISRASSSVGHVTGLKVAQYCFRSPQPVRLRSRVRQIQAKGRIVE
jgi:hypothetical protein